MKRKHFQTVLPEADHRLVKGWAGLNGVEVAVLMRSLLTKAAADPDGVGKQLIALARD